MWFINQLGQYELLTLDSEEEEISEVRQDDLPTELRAIVDYIDVLAKENNAIIPDKPWLAPLGEQIVTPAVNREEEWAKERDLKVDIAFMDFPDQQAQRVYMFDLEEDKHMAIYGSSGFGKSTALQTIVMSLARKNTPEQVQFNLFDFGTNGLLPLKDLPHSADLVRAEEDEKLGKFLDVVRSEVARRKEMFTEVSVASIGQYEVKTGEKLPVIVTVVDAFDGIKEDQKLFEALDSLLMQLLRDGANIGMYLLATGLRSNTFKGNTSSNIPTKIALFLSDENDLIAAVGNDRLPAQEMEGRAQIKLDSPRSMQFYLPSAGEDDFRRLEALGAEIEMIDKSWEGARPIAIPMLPKEIGMKWFLRNQEVRGWINEGSIPLGLSMVTTEVRGFRPKDDPYFLIVDVEESQTDYLTTTVYKVFEGLAGKYKRIVFDSTEEIKNKNAFDEIINPEAFNTSIASVVTDFNDRLSTPSGRHQSELIYINDTTFLSKSGVSPETFFTLMKKGSSVGIHLLIHTSKDKLKAHNDINNSLKNNAKVGLVGMRKSDQKYVKFKTQYTEPALEHDEHHYFNGRLIEKIKIVSQE